VVIATACAYYPVHLSLWLGQNTTFVLLGCCGVYAGLRSRRDGLLGGMLLLVALKPQLLPLVVGLLVLERRWKALTIAGGALATIVIAVTPILGLAWPLHYLRFVLVDSNRGAAVAEKPMYMVTWRGVAVNLFGESAPSLVTPLFIALAVLTLGGFLWVWWRVQRRGGAGAQTVWALALVVTILISPHLNPHDLSILIAPAWLICSQVLVGEP